ncbi:hypothetical protein NE683_17550 [Bariatricus massiliensis]|nr:hypothetical protein [Bariatricus massiliensis]MDY2663752.1 hypothetical protein [Bariatricus massiliensis]
MFVRVRHIRRGGESPSCRTRESMRLSDAARYFSTLRVHVGLRLSTPSHLTESPYCIVPVTDGFRTKEGGGMS